MSNDNDVLKIKLVGLNVCTHVVISTQWNELMKMRLQKKKRL